MNRYKIKDDIDLKELEKRGFKYMKPLQAYFLTSTLNKNWEKILLQIDKNRMVKAGGTSINLEKEIKIIEDLVEVIYE